MMHALQKANNVDLMERYTTTCVACHWIRQFFGTAKGAREEAERMGWEFRREYRSIYGIERVANVTIADWVERAYCPHCKLLV